MSDMNKDESIEKLPLPIAQIKPGVRIQINKEDNGAISADLLRTLTRINDVKQIVENLGELNGFGRFVDNFHQLNDITYAKDAQSAPRQPFPGLRIKIVRPQRGAVSTLMNATMRMMRDDKININFESINIEDQFNVLQRLKTEVEAPQAGENLSGHKIHLVGGEENETGIFSVEQGNGFYLVTFKYRDKEVKAKEADCFAAFSLIRLHLADEGLIPFCYGASLNVYITDEIRETGFGLLALKLHSRIAPTPEHLVRIFDAGPDVVPASVDAQEKYWEEWKENNVELER